MTKYPKLPPVFKAKWVAALRSGKYKQGKIQLKRVDDDGKITYCCLGVACEVVHQTPTSLYLLREDMKKLPKALRMQENNGVQFKLANLNDHEEWSFRRIATWIEKNL